MPGVPGVPGVPGAGPQPWDQEAAALGVLVEREELLPWVQGGVRGAP